MTSGVETSRISDRAITIDCLASCKAEVSRDAVSIAEAAHPAIREMFVRINQDHLRMQWELFELARRRGWYRVPAAAEQVIYQLPSVQLDATSAPSPALVAARSAPQSSGHSQQ